MFTAPSSWPEKRLPQQIVDVMFDWPVERRERERERRERERERRERGERERESAMTSAASDIGF